MIGCLLDAEAMSFDPFKIEVCRPRHSGTRNPLSRFLQIVEGIDTLMYQAKVFAKEQRHRLHALGLQPRKLVAAGRLFEQMFQKFDFEKCAPLDDDVQTQKIYICW